MKNYILSAEAMVMISGSSAGTQPKYYERGYWYKANQNGYEATAEYLAGLVLSCSNVEEYVSYELCMINGRAGCRSKSFLSSTEAFISFQRLYDMYHGGNLSERIRTPCPHHRERLDFVKSFVLDYSGVDCAEYLSKTLGLDCLILNTDRHFNNLGIIADRESGCAALPPSLITVTVCSATMVNSVRRILWRKIWTRLTDSLFPPAWSSRQKQPA